MKVLLEPKIQIIGETTTDHDQIDQFLNENEMTWQTDTEVGSEQIAEFGGRICYMSYGKGRKTNQEYLGHIIKVGHGSVLEHGVFNIAVTGVSRSLTHEFIRHRAGFAYSQLSQRYVDSTDTNYVIPPIFIGKGNLEEEFKKDCEMINGLYEKWADFAKEILVEKYPDMKKTDRRKNVRQSARWVLPNAAETKLLISANMRALRHLVFMRASPGPDLEIRRLAIMILKECQKKAPPTFLMILKFIPSRMDQKRREQSILRCRAAPAWKM